MLRPYKERTSDSSWRAILPEACRREGDGCADMDGDFADARQTTVLALHLPDAVETHRNDRDAKIFCEESMPLWNGRHLAGAELFTSPSGKTSTL